MADLIATTAGTNTMAEAIEPTHAQCARGQILDADVPGTTEILAANFIKNWVVSQVVRVNSTLQVLIQDEDLVDTYPDAQTWALWNGDPADADSILLGIFSNDVAVGKAAGLRLSVSMYWVLTDAQAASVNFDNVPAPLAGRRNAGLVEFTTGAEWRAGSPRRALSNDLDVPIERLPVATQDNWDDGDAGFLLTSDLSPPSDDLPSSSTTEEGIIEQGTNSEYRNATLGKAVTTDLHIPDGRLRVRNIGTSINASLTNPQIRHIQGVNAAGELEINSNAGSLPVLIINNIGNQALGIAWKSIYLQSLRLHPAGNSGVYADGDDVKLNDALDAFLNTGSTKIGQVLDGNQATGRYEVVLDLWSPFLGDAGGREENSMLFDTVGQHSFNWEYDTDMARVVLVGGGGGGAGGIDRAGGPLLSPLSGEPGENSTITVNNIVYSGEGGTAGGSETGDGNEDTVGRGAWGGTRGSPAGTHFGGNNSGGTGANGAGDGGIAGRDGGGMNSPYAGSGGGGGVALPVLLEINNIVDGSVVTVNVGAGGAGQAGEDGAGAGGAGGAGGIAGEDGGDGEDGVSQGRLGGGGGGGGGANGWVLITPVYEN